MIKSRFFKFIALSVFLETLFIQNTSEKILHYTDSTEGDGRHIPLQQEIDFKIVGGKDASVEDFPYMVSIQDSFVHICGGSIITELFILTAAHCVTLNERNWQIVDPLDLNVVAGQTILDLGDGQFRDVRQIYVHQNFDSQSMKYDVALVLIFEPFKWTSYVKAVNLYSGGSKSFGDHEYCTACGWGVQEKQSADTKQGKLPDRNILQKVDLPPSTEKACRTYFETYHKQSVFDETKLCVILSEEKDTCFGDSGGPLICEGIQYGITSFGVGCALTHMYGIYVNLSVVRDWISNTVRHEEKDVPTRHVKMVELTRRIPINLDGNERFPENNQNVPQLYGILKSVVISFWTFVFVMET